MLAWVVALSCAACGGGPALGNLPRPNTAVVAGTAAAIAGAATLANPDSAGKKPEAPSWGTEKHTVTTERMPGDVLDRLDSAEEKGDVTTPEQRAAVPAAPDAASTMPLPPAPKTPKIPQSK